MGTFGFVFIRKTPEVRFQQALDVPLPHLNRPEERDTDRLEQSVPY